MDMDGGENFISPDNLCGQNLLRITSRGSAIIAELLRLAGYIPEVFLKTEDIKDKEQLRYGEVLFDFHYLREPDDFEKKINDSQELLDLDNDFQENYGDILERFYGLFESIWKYQTELAKYVDDVNNGFYIQHSVDNILQDVNGKQLLCEAFYLYGVMLMSLEEHIPGYIREKMLVALYRSVGASTLVNIDDICKLCRNTGYVPGPNGKKPKNHPEAFFARFSPDAETVRLVIGRLQTDDIYLMAKSFPNPDHRSTRLAGQASMLYVILFFAPDILNKKKPTMREIVDKHFNDNWVIPVFMGRLVDLSVEWASYPAAKTAMDNVLTTSFVNQTDAANKNLFQKCLENVSKYLVEGVLIPEYLLDKIETILNVIRECNVCLRWRILHRRANNPAVAKTVCGSVREETIVTLLLNSSQLEYIVKGMLEQLLEEKDRAWNEGKESAAERMTELSEYFTGEKALTRVKRDDHMVQWFAGLASQVRALNLEEGSATATGRRIQGIIAALEDVEQFEAVDTNLQIKSYLNEVRDLFRQMIRTVNIKNSLMHVLEDITDLSYAWETLGDYLQTFHNRIRQDPGAVVLLRAMFLKTASILDIPLVRITAIDSPDAISVAEYYSGELVEFVRKVLEIIPISVFQLLNRIVKIQTHKLTDIPIRFEAKDLKNFAQLDDRLEMSKLTHQVSIFTEGVLVMEKTLLGVIQVDPRQILEEGLRRELVRQIGTAMHTNLAFKSFEPAAIEQVFSSLALSLNGYKKSVEYVQDYINIAGLKIYQEELSRVINYNAEQESNRYLKKKTFDSDSRFQNRAIPIPRFAPVQGDGYIDTGATNFMGQVMLSLLYITDSTRTVYAPESSAWFIHPAADQKQVPTVESCGIRTFNLLNQSVGAIGLRGLDRLLAFRVVFEYNTFLKFYKSSVNPFRTLLEQVRDGLFPEYRMLSNPAKLYSNAMKKVEKLMLPILQNVRRIGQVQLIRRQIANLLQFECQLDAHILHQSLDTFNRGLLNDVKNHYRDPEKFNYPGKDDNSLLFETTSLLEACGMDDPLQKIYVTSDPLEGLPQLLFLFLISYLPKVIILFYRVRHVLVV
jgi:WASH complex subunit strumpellin